MPKAPATVETSEKQAAPAASSERTVKMIRPEDLQPKPCVMEVPDRRVQEFRDAGWVEKTDAEIEALLKEREPKPQGTQEA